jgi:hypothetical protein
MPRYKLARYRSKGKYASPLKRRARMSTPGRANAPLSYCELEFVCAWALCCGGGLSFEAFV